MCFDDMREERVISFNEGFETISSLKNLTLCVGLSSMTTQTVLLKARDDSLIDDAGMKNIKISMCAWLDERAKASSSSDDDEGNP